MNDEHFGIFLLVTTVLAGTTLLLGSLVSPGRRRGLSDWVMIGGIGTFSFALVAMMLLIFVASPYRYGSGNREFWQAITMMLAVAIPGGLALFSAGFLLARFEARRQTAQLDMMMQGFYPAPGSLPPAGPLQQPPAGVPAPLDPPAGPPPGAGSPQ